MPLFYFDLRSKGELRKTLFFLKAGTNKAVHDAESIHDMISPVKTKAELPVPDRFGCRAFVESNQAILDIAVKYPHPQGVGLPLSTGRA